jgi:aspartyl-tRNA(Asn)/glutamyl-tRNA(Gln) amidotransferase subunit C
MKIDRDEARRIARLAHLEFDDVTLDRFAGEMTRILSYIDQLAEVDVTGVEETAAHLLTPMRDDTPVPSIDRELVSGNAPAFAHGLFVVPKVIGGS